MIAIYKKELRTYYGSVIGFLFAAATLFLIGLYFTIYNIFQAYPNISYSLSSTVILFMISIPILTMRILAEERKQKTDQLILTAPISVGKIVAGKFFALETIFAIPMLIICIYPLILNLFGKVPMGESYVSILGFFLYGTACIAIGIFVSSITESQVIAAVVTFAVLFLGYVMNGICNMMVTNSILSEILLTFDMSGRFGSLLYGTFDMSAVLYFLTVTAVMLFLTTQSIQKRRYSVSVKTLKVGAYSTGMTAIVLIIAVVLNLAVAQLPSNISKIDVTIGKLYSITEQSEKIISGITEPITIYVLASKDNKDEMVAQTLENYESLSSYIEVEYVDPNINPGFYKQYTSDDTLQTNSLIVESEKRSKVINYSKLFQTEMDYTTYQTTTTGYDGEGQITSALNYVTSENMPKIYMIEGHGETVMEADYLSAVEKENVTYESINLLKQDAVPEDASGIIINGATSDFSTDDAAKIREYLDNGGNALVVTAVTDVALPNFESILNEYGLQTEEGVVVEQDENYYYQNPMLLLPEVSDNEITNGIYGASYIFVPYAKGITVAQGLSENLEVTAFLSSTESSYLKNDISNLENFEKIEGAIEGPFAIGAKAVKTNEEGIESTLICYASTNLFSQKADSMVSGANLTLFSNSLSGFVEHEVSVSVPVKEYKTEYLTIPQSKVIWIGLITTFLLPIGLLIAGIIIWAKRRRR